jgi:hypothetical protein
LKSMGGRWRVGPFSEASTLLTLSIFNRWPLFKPFDISTGYLLNISIIWKQNLFFWITF